MGEAVRCAAPKGCRVSSLLWTFSPSWAPSRQSLPSKGTLFAGWEIHEGGRKARFISHTLLADDSGMKEWVGEAGEVTWTLLTLQRERKLPFFCGIVLYPPDLRAMLPQSSALNPGLVLLVPPNPSAGPDAVPGVLTLLHDTSPTSVFPPPSSLGSNAGEICGFPSSLWILSVFIVCRVQRVL